MEDSWVVGGRCADPGFFLCHFSHFRCLLANKGPIWRRFALRSDCAWLRYTIGLQQPSKLKFSAPSNATAEKIGRVLSQKVPIGKASRWLHLPMAEASISWPCTKMSILRVVTSPMRSISDKKKRWFPSWRAFSPYTIQPIIWVIYPHPKKKLQSCLHRVTHHPCHCECCINMHKCMISVEACCILSNVRTRRTHPGGISKIRYLRRPHASIPKTWQHPKSCSEAIFRALVDHRFPQGGAPVR